jgi:ABC-2 type transport system permease protein
MSETQTQRRLEAEAVGRAQAPLPAAVDTRGASLRAIGVICRRDLLRAWRDRSRLLGAFAGPILFLVVFGVGFGSALRGAGGSWGSLSYSQFIFPGIVSMGVLFNAIFGAMSIVWDREFGFLREMLVAPIDRSAVALGKILGSATLATIQGMVLLALAPLIGVRLTPLAVVELVPLIFVLAFAMAGLGVAIAARMESMQGFQLIGNFLLQPMFFLSGALFPIVGLPGWMTVLTRIDPVAYGVDPLRRVVLQATSVPAPVVNGFAVTWFGTTLSIAVEVAILLAFGLICASYAALSFRRRD